MRIGIVDYGAGNILSVYNSIFNLGFDPEIVNDSNELNSFDKIIIPGVGSAFKALKKKKKKGFISNIRKFYNSGKPILGICLGLQIFATRLFEDGESDGIGIIDGNIELINEPQKFNIGWCEVNIDNNLSKKIGIKENSDFYFCHSYYLKFNSNVGKSNCFGDTFFYKKIPSIVLKNNFIGTQFHPEKSQTNGIKFLNFYLKSFL